MKKYVISSVGVYYKSETHQVIGYYTDLKRLPEYFVEVCVIEINNPFQYSLVAAVKNQLNNSL